MNCKDEESSVPVRCACWCQNLLQSVWRLKVFNFVWCLFAEVDRCRLEGALHLTVKALKLPGKTRPQVSLLVQECQGCANRRKENAEKGGFMGRVARTFGPNAEKKEHEDLMKETTTFDELPNCLVLHFMRTKHEVDEHSRSILVKDETAVAPNLVIVSPNLWLLQKVCRSMTFNIKTNIKPATLWECTTCRCRNAYCTVRWTSYYLQHLSVDA